jgi:hypothetical protein
MKWSLIVFIFILLCLMAFFVRRWIIAFDLAHLVRLEIHFMHYHYRFNKVMTFRLDEKLMLKNPTSSLFRGRSGVHIVRVRRWI